jgi:transglutaminase-like putative cysteine protease
MRPRETHHLSILRYRLELDPPAKLYWARDHHENSLAMAHCYERLDRFRVQAESAIETLDRNPYDFFVRMDAVRFPFAYTEPEAALLAPYLSAQGGSAGAVLDWVRTIIPSFPEETLEVVTRINTSLREHIGYRERLEMGVQDPLETIRLRFGTCRDFAVLMVDACRALGIAARFVTGYLYDPTVPAGQPMGSLHAWTEAFLPGIGWKGFDPTHAILTDDHFIPVAVGRGPSNLNPVTGALWGGPEASATMEATVAIREL